MIRFDVLGALEAWDSGREIELGPARQRTVLALLILHANEIVSSDRLVDALWGENSPASAAKAVQGYVSGLRRALPAKTIATRGSGYVLRADEIDAVEFERLLARARQEEPQVASVTLREALCLWRGRPFADVEYEPWAQAEIARLEECRLVALEERIDVDLQLGEAQRLVAEVEALVADHPFRERLRAQLMLALYRSGRQADALRVFADCRARLVEELGIEPGRELQDLQRRILAHDPALGSPPRPRPLVVPGRAVFVGRDRELEELRAGLDEAHAGRGSLFLLVGEPGIGKSRLAEELGEEARGRGARVRVGRCWEAGGAPAYWPWLQVLRAYAQESEAERLLSQLGAGAYDLTQLLPELRALSPDLPEPPSLDPESARFRLFDAVSSFLRSAAEECPLVLVLDDLHAADEPSLLLLRFVTRQLRASRLLVIGAYRDVDPIPPGELVAALTELAREPVTKTLPLRGLAEAEVGRYLQLTTDGVPSAGVVATVYAGTEGNPLFVSEVVRLLAAEGRLDAVGPRLAVPPGVRDVIARRLRHLSAECRGVLELASVLGREFDLELLADTSGLERSRLLDVLDEAIAVQLVNDVPGSRLQLRFGHALVRDVLYDNLPFARRRQLHQAVGEALDQRPDRDAHLAELAHHFCEAIPAVDSGKAVDYARRAGDQAVSLLAPEEADRLYETALSLVDGRDRPRLLLRTARSMWMRGERAEERAVEAREVLVAAGDGDGAAEAELLLADIHWYEGSRQLASEDMQRALAFVRGAPVTATTADVLEHASRFDMLADEANEAIDVGREALAIARKLGLQSIAAHCLSSIGVARARSGDLGGMDDIRAALKIAVAAQDGWATWRARVNLADCLLWQVGEADRAFAERHELRRLLHAARSWPITRWNQSYDAWESYWKGRWTESARLCDDFIEHVEAGNPHNTAPEMYSLRALIRVSRGDKQALDDASAAVTLGRRAKDPRSLYPALALGAGVAAEHGHGEVADRLLDELLVADGPEPYPGYVVSLALTALLRGRADEVQGHLELLEPSPWRDASSALLRSDYVDAAERFAAIGVLPEEARARLLAAQAFAAADQQAQVEVQLAHCEPFFESVGATAYLARSSELHAPRAPDSVPPGAG